MSHARSHPGFHVVIPARYGSSRLPGKPLLQIDGKPMVRHVCEQARESGAKQVVVATDDQRIVDAVDAFGGEVMLTSTEHRSGTDRIAEVAERMGWAADTVVVNLQGDEPAMPPELVHQVAEDMLAHGDADVTTLATPILDKPHLFDPHVVKVVTDRQGYALYFSRAPIPWHRDEFAKGADAVPQGVDFLRHIGLYAYRVGFLERFVEMPQAPIEAAESLEQLRVLWQGGRIHVSLAKMDPGHGVDTVDDLNRVRERWGKR